MKTTLRFLLTPFRMALIKKAKTSMLLSYLGDRDRRPVQTNNKTLSQKQARHSNPCLSVITASGGRGKRIMVQGWQKAQDPI
jgi:hypothetical protein